VPKAYWITTYRAVRNSDALAAYARLAGPAIEAGGGRFVVRGMPARSYEGGLDQRVVIIEFESLSKAVATYESAAYRAALKALGDGAERDVRFAEGTS
jgi:uncharacterized protein (DUF1330 family)